jgi:DNA-directed RNA polymerase specialized sigma subunit
LELEGRLAKEKLNLLNLEIQIRAMCRGVLSPLERAVITWRYICRLKWKDIADRAEISEMQTMREHNAAIKKLETDCISRLTNSIAN